MFINKKKLIIYDLIRLIVLLSNIICWVWVIKSNFSTISGLCLIVLTIISITVEIILSKKDNDNII